MNTKHCYLSILVALLVACSEGGTGGAILPVESDGQPSSGFSLVPSDSQQSFEAFIKLGLSQWAGTVESARAVSLSSSLELVLTAEAALSGGASGGSTSELNVQVVGVDEADSTRFDGSYLYSTDNDAINILLIDNTNPSATLVNTLHMQNKTRVGGLYLAAADQQTTLLAVLGSDFYY